MDYPQRFQNLIECFKYLPGIGTKTAERMAYDILDKKKERVEEFATALLDVFNLKHCHICGNLCDEDTCNICNESDRDSSLICVVHYPKDVFAFEKMKEYHGVYHVLNGYISPTKGKGEEDINLASLIQRVQNGNIKEVILATNLTVEGEITALYISNMLKEYPVKVTRLAHGLPMGAQLDYADEMTLYRAFSNRKEV